MIAQGRGAGRKLRDQTTTVAYSRSEITMTCWIDAINSCGHDRKRRAPGIESSAVPGSVNAEGEAAGHAEPCGGDIGGELPRRAHAQRARAAAADHGQLGLLQRSIEPRR